MPEGLSWPFENPEEIFIVAERKAYSHTSAFREGLVYLSRLQPPDLYTCRFLDPHTSEAFNVLPQDGEKSLPTIQYLW